MAVKLSISISDDQANLLVKRYPDLGWSARIQAEITPPSIEEQIAFHEAEIARLRSEQVEASR